MIITAKELLDLAINPSGLVHSDGILISCDGESITYNDNEGINSMCVQIEVSPYDLMYWWLEGCYRIAPKSFDEGDIFDAGFALEIGQPLINQCIGKDTWKFDGKEWDKKSITKDDS